MGFLEAMGQRMVDTIDSMTLRYSHLIKANIIDYCDFDTPLDKYSLATHYRTILSFIEIRGILGHVGDAEFVELIARLELLMNRLLQTPAHSIQWVFARSPSQTQAQLSDYFLPLQQAAYQQGFSTEIIEALFAERMQCLNHVLSAECGYLVFVTHPEAIGNIERQAQQKASLQDEKRQALKENDIPRYFGDYAQSPIVSISRLQLIHESSLKTLMNQLTGSSINLSIKLLSCHEAIQSIRHLHHPGETDKNWQPVLPGDQIPYRKEAIVPGANDHIFYPIIAAQIFRRSMDVENEVIQSGEDYWATTSMELSPQAPERFDRLFASIPKTIDWRFSLTFLGGDKKFSSKIRMRRALAKIFKVTNQKQNEPIASHCEHLLGIRDEGELLVGVRLQLAVRANTKASALEGIQRCARLLQAWGNCETTFERGDPVDALVSTLPGLDRFHTGTTLIQPVRESAILCPITRPVSPWQSFGTNLYRSRDGKIYPVQLCSDEQVTWIDLIFAKPGSGKSVLLNAQNLNLCLTPGLSKLPRISILDIGPSSLGLIQLLQAMLPENRRGEAVHKTLKQDKSASINPFDTVLGMRFPHAAKTNFLKSFLLLLFTEDGETRIKPGIGELVTMLIMETYKAFSDDYSPKRYEPYVEPEIDQLIHAHPDWFYVYQKPEANYKNKQTMTWWQVVDVLSEQACWREATLAQRQAVPLLVDLTSILHSNQMIKDIYAKTAQDEAVLLHLIKMVRSSINDYVILSHPTQFNLGEARVVALDLADVTGSGSEYTLKKSGLMYMLGREVLFGHLYFGDEDIKPLKKVYQNYHAKRIHQELGDIKRVCCDEYHRTADLQAVRQQMEQDMREGRKYKIAFSLASQRHQDFTQTMVSLATNIYICNGATGTTLDEVCQVFDLNASERQALKYEVHGATREGASFLFKSETKAGWVTQVLVSNLGLIELWALSSSAEDVLLRKKLVQKMPYFDALMQLAHQFPTGTAKKVIAERALDSGQSVEVIIEAYIESMVMRYQQKINLVSKTKEY